MSAAPLEVETITATPFQAKVLAVPETLDAFLGGGRGGGKSFCLGLLILRHVETFGEKARVLYLRRTHASLEDFVGVTRQLFGPYGRGARYNIGEGHWRLPNGAYVELGILAEEAHYARYQGRSFTLILVDEVTQHPTPRLVDLLRSNLRGPKGIPKRIVLAGNPGEVGHIWAQRRYMAGRTPWIPYTEPDSGTEFVSCPSIYADNPHLDPEEYTRQLRAACASDEELLKAWLHGDWNIARGAYFASVVSASVGFDPWDPENWPGKAVGGLTRSQRRNRWDSWLAHDFGSAAPSVTYLCARSPGGHGPDGRFYPRNSILLVDELATNDPNDLNTGLGWTVPTLADAIQDLICDKWRVRPDGVADDACFAQTGHRSGSIADEFRSSGIHFRPAMKGDRISGWQMMRRMLEAASNERVDVPGLYVSTACTYWWQTVPFLARDPKRVEDVDSRGPDHGADAARYGLRGGPRFSWAGELL